MISICYIYNTVDPDAIIISVPNNMNMEYIIQTLSFSYQQKIDMIGKDKILVDILEKDVKHTDINYVRDKWQRILNPLHSFRTFLTPDKQVRWTYKLSFDKRHCILENRTTKDTYKLWQHKRYTTINPDETFVIDKIEPDHMIGRVKKNRMVMLNYYNIPLFLTLQQEQDVNDDSHNRHQDIKGE